MFPAAAREPYLRTQNQILKVVSIPIPFKQSTTAPSRFVPVEAEDYSHLTISGNVLGQVSRPSADPDEDYITAAERILPPLSPAGETGSKYMTTAGGSLSRVRPAASKDDGSSIMKSHSTSSFGSITSSVAKPIEFTYRNKLAMMKAGGAGGVKSQRNLDAESMLGAGGPATNDDDDDAYLEQSQLTFCSDIENGVNTQMSEKTAAERQLMIRVCGEAMKKRLVNLEYYKSVFEKEKDRVQRSVDKYQPSVGKSELGQLMLTMVTEREEVINKSRSAKPVTCWHQVNHENNGRHYLPVYCLKGKTYLGRHTDHPRQPHTFADLTSLRNPKNDPPGYRRYSKLINLEGFDNNEILIHARGNQLRFDGFALCKKSCDEVGDDLSADVNRKSKVVTLPKGVYPERLSVGRSSSGMLVIQEPWKF